jgi:hypothetical protein
MGNPIKPRHKAFIVSYLIFVAGVVVTVRISPEIGAALIIVALALAAYLLIDFIAGRLSVKQHKTTFGVVLSSLIAAVLFIFCWQPIVRFATPTIGELPNSYIHQTINNDGTLLEFGVRRYETKLDITIVTKDGYENIDDWWDSPALNDRGDNAQCADCPFWSQEGRGFIVMQQPDIAIRSIESPVFKFTLNSPKVTPERSYYVRFNATETVVIQSVIFGSVTAIGE